MFFCAEGKAKPEEVSFRLRNEVYNRTSRKAGFNSGKKSITQGCKTQAQYIVDPLVQRGFRISGSPDRILLDKNKKSDTNPTEGHSFFLAFKNVATPIPSFRKEP